MSNALLLSVFPLMMIAAGIGDILTMRIPNWLNGAIVVTFFIVAFIMAMPLAVMQWHLVAGAALLVAGMALFFFGGFGGGDAKMLAAGALWVGWDGLIPFLVYTALAGGVLALVMILWSHLQVEKEVRGSTWMKRVFRTDLDLPYGVAIAAGGVFAFPQTWWMETIAHTL